MHDLAEALVTSRKEKEEAAARSFHWMEVKTGSETITPLTQENKYTFIQKDYLISLGLGIRSVDYLSRSPVSINPASPRRNKLRTFTFQDHSTFTVLTIAKKKKLGVKLHLCSQITHKASCKSASPQGRQSCKLPIILHGYTWASWRRKPKKMKRFF